MDNLFHRFVNFWHLVSAGLCCPEVLVYAIWVPQHPVLLVCFPKKMWTSLNFSQKRIENLFCRQNRQWSSKIILKIPFNLCETFPCGPYLCLVSIFRTKSIIGPWPMYLGLESGQDLYVGSAMEPNQYWIHPRLYSCLLSGQQSGRAADPPDRLPSNLFSPPALVVSSQPR